MGTVDFIRGGAEILDEVEPLWRKLNKHHQGKSTYFAEHFARFTFAERRQDLEHKAEVGALLVEIARDRETGDHAGYCVSSVDGEGVGEIDSLFVEADYRGRGVGDLLISRALAWLEERGARDTKIVVAYGNEEVLAFYARYGFYPRTYVLRRRDSEPGGTGSPARA